MAADTGAGRRRVVIVGGGFGGLAAAQGLRRADADVTVVDRMNHHQASGTAGRGGEGNGDSDDSR